MFWVDYSFNGKQIRHSLGTRNPDEALAMASNIPPVRCRDRTKVPAGYPKHFDRPWDAMVSDGFENSGSWLWVIHSRTKYRATHRGVIFALTKLQLETIARRSCGKCELTGRDFSWERVGDALFSPYAPSLDRVIPKLGYTMANCRLICYGANVAISDWGADVFEDLALHYLRTKKDTANTPDATKMAPISVTH